MLDFRKLLSPKTRKFGATRTNRIIAFQNMDRIGMAEELLVARRELADSGLFLSEDHINVWGSDEWVLHRLIPALAAGLNPDVELRADEMAGRNEGWDPAALTRSGDFRQLNDSFALSLSLRPFARLSPGTTELRGAALFLCDGDSSVGAITVGLDTLTPGLYPIRNEPDPRPPLEGAQLIATYGDHDRVLRYAETPEELKDLFDASIVSRQAGEITLKQRQTLRQLSSWPERLDFDAVSIQTVDGDILREWRLEAPSEEDAPRQEL